MRLLAAALLFLAAAAPVIAADPLLEPTAFRDRMASALSKSTGQSIEKIDPQSFRTKTANGTEITVSIDNAYAEYQSDPSRLDAILAKYARILSKTSDDPNETIDQLVVIVRPSDYLTRSLPAGAPPDSIVPPRAMAGDLSYFLAIDSPETIRTATVADLKRWKLDEAAAWTRAIANIRQHVGRPESYRLGGEDGPSGIGAESGLAPSLLADPALCGPTAESGTEGQVILLYARDMFLFATPGDKTQMERFWKGVRAETAANRSLSSTPLTCHDGHWVIARAP